MKKIIIESFRDYEPAMGFIDKNRIDKSHNHVIVDLSETQRIISPIVGFILDTVFFCIKNDIKFEIIPPENKFIKKEIECAIGYINEKYTNRK